MDNRISVRFFRIVPLHETAPSFGDVLLAALASGATPVEREREISPGVRVRLERLSQDGSFLDGEIVRRQTVNVPPEATDAGLSPLPLSEGGGLGHCIAFRYSTRLGVLAIQYDNRAVSVGRLLAYLREGDATADYKADPLVRQDAWERYNRGEPRSFYIEIAQPAELPAVEGPVGAATDSSKRLAEFFGGPVIKVEVGMGRRNGSLAKRAVDSVIEYFTRGQGRESDVRRLSVDVKPEDGKTETIDFIEEFLVIRDELDLPERNPGAHYEIRRNYLTTCFNRHLDHIRDVYGAAP